MVGFLEQVKLTGTTTEAEGLLNSKSHSLLKQTGGVFLVCKSGLECSVPVVSHIKHTLAHGHR